MNENRSEAEGEGPRAGKRAREALYGPPEAGRLAREGGPRKAFAHPRTHFSVFRGNSITVRLSVIVGSCPEITQYADEPHSENIRQPR